MNTNPIPPTSLISAAILTGCIVIGFKIGRLFPASQPLDLWSLLQVIMALIVILLIHEATRSRIEFLTGIVRSIPEWQRVPYWRRTKAAGFAFTARAVWAWVQVSLLGALGFIQFLWRAGFSNPTALRQAYEEWLASLGAEFQNRTEEAARKWIAHGVGRATARKLIVAASTTAKKAGNIALGNALLRMASHTKDEERARSVDGGDSNVTPV
jgi:hypothetical protein